MKGIVSLAVFLFMYLLIVAHCVLSQNCCSSGSKKSLLFSFNSRFEKLSVSSSALIGHQNREPPPLPPQLTDSVTHNTPHLSAELWGTSTVNMYSLQCSTTQWKNTRISFFLSLLSSAHSKWKTYFGVIPSSRYPPLGTHGTLWKGLSLRAAHGALWRKCLCQCFSPQTHLSGEKDL